MLSVLAFFIWGTGVIKDFALALVVGIVAGTYSSIYVAAPLTEWIDQQDGGPAEESESRRRRADAAAASRPPRRRSCPEFWESQEGRKFPSVRSLRFVAVIPSEARDPTSFANGVLRAFGPQDDSGPSQTPVPPL